MARTAEEIHSRNVSKFDGRKLYNISGPSNNAELFKLKSREMLFSILADPSFDTFFTDQERTNMESRLIIEHN